MPPDIREALSGISFSDLASVKRLSLHGAREVGLSYNLSTERSAISHDVVFNGIRYYIYQSNAVDEAEWNVLEKAGVPLISDRIIPLKGWIFALPIPLNTTRIDNIPLREEEFTGGGYLGAMEIMSKLGLHLAQIYRGSGKLPGTCDTGDIALVNGSPDFIRLVPPLNLKEDISIDDLAGCLLTDLRLSDPDNRHVNQIKAMRKAYYQYLSKNG